MPRVSAFDGIVIWMYYDEPQHQGRAHFHACHGDDEATIDVEAPAVIAGQLSQSVRRVLLAWAREHRAQLRENWARAARHEPLVRIDPPS
ncbi:MAG TPA: DUF4160 domain-containing protein [Solirubrobacteraceae bacterium]|nr:DUF4160 domain-containing protein [Solirubrobacteraceae bacterium]